MALRYDNGEDDGGAVLSDDELAVMLARAIGNRRRLPIATRGECEEGARPCAYVMCRHHLGVDAQANGETCSLDVADRGEHTLEEVSAFFGLTRERIRQIEARALLKLAIGIGTDARPRRPKRRAASATLKRSEIEEVDCEHEE